MLLAKNRKALFNNEVLEKFVAGIVLKGYEVKAIREKNVSFEGSFIKLIDGKPYITGLHIGRYSKQSQDVDETKRDRALLLGKREVLKLQTALNEKGKTAIPLALVLRNNLVKLELAIVKGQKKYEKKAVAKEKQMKKDMERMQSEIRRSI